MALWIEALFSPVWLNSNGLRFDFPPGHKAGGVHTTHTHTSRLFGRRGACREEEEHTGTTAKCGDRQGDNMDDHMVNDGPQFNLDMCSEPESNQSYGHISWTKLVGLQSENHSIKRESLVDVEREEMRRTIR